MNGMIHCMNRQIYSAPEKPSGEAKLCGIYRKDKVNRRRLCILFSLMKRVTKFHRYLKLSRDRINDLMGICGIQGFYKEVS